MSKYYVETVVEQIDINEGGLSIIDLDHGDTDKVMDFIRLPYVVSKEQIYDDLEKGIIYHIGLNLWNDYGYDTDYINYNYETIFAEGFGYHKAIEKKILRLIRLAMQDKRATALQTLLSKEYNEAIRKKDLEIEQKLDIGETT